MTSKSFHRRVIRYGPGGYHCQCCGPHPKKRQQDRRLVRKREMRLLAMIEALEQNESRAAADATNPLNE